MDRQSALILTIIFFMVFIFLAYYGAKLTMLSTIVLATFISLILLNIFYPPNKITQDPNDFTLVIYLTLEVIGIIIIVFYVSYMTLADTRQCYLNDQ
jgi:uncharacterized membrane protein YoaK (UPF0700 family)